MHRPGRSTIIGVAVAVAVVAACPVTAWWVFACHPPRDQAEMIELFEADPIVATAPEDGQLAEEYSHTYTCDSGLPHGGSPTGPGFAEVRRLYTTPAAYGVDQLRQRFDQPAAAGDWRLLRTGPDIGGEAWILYCREAGGRVVIARVSSSADSVYQEPAETHGDRSIPGVDVILSADPDHGTDCNDELREYR